MIKYNSEENFCHQVTVKYYTQHSKSGIGRQAARLVFGRAAIDAHILRLHISNEKSVIVWHDMHPSFTGSREIDTAIFLPCDLGCWVSLCSALQPSDCPGADGQIHGCLQEGGELWEKPLVSYFHCFTLVSPESHKNIWIIFI